MILRGGRLLVMDEGGRSFVGDLAIAAGRIAAIGANLAAGADEEIVDCRGHLVMPGFVQAHVHLCQTLLRNQADDLALLDWLRQRVWPYEAWLDADAMRAAADLGLAELVDGGTTALLDMGSVRHTDELFAAARAAGVRYTGGKCLMDLNEDGRGPAELFESADQALAETTALIERHHRSENGRLRYAVAPRFAVSCSDDLLKRAVVLACRADARIHTHASENKDEVAAVLARTGRRNIDYLSDLGVLGSQTAIAHCVHLVEHEVNLLWGTGTHVVHCPSSNLKLGSGIAPIPALLEQGINVALGADGAPCNNRLDIFREMHLASLVQKPIHGPKAMPAEAVLRMATIGGARALGLEDEIGSLEAGKKADIVVLDLDRPETQPEGDPYAAVVFSASPANVRHVLVDGVFLKRDGRLLRVDRAEVGRRAAAESARFRGAAPGSR